MYYSNGVIFLPQIKDIARKEDLKRISNKRGGNLTLEAWIINAILSQTA